jgi:heme/copper-type cytochrome/quinol oxidase subunit 2
VCGQVEVSAMGRSLIQRNPTEYVCVSECVLETSTMRRLKPTSAVKQRTNIIIVITMIVVVVVVVVVVIININTIIHWRYVS